MPSTSKYTSGNLIEVSDFNPEYGETTEAHLKISSDFKGFLPYLTTHNNLSVYVTGTWTLTFDQQFVNGNVLVVGDGGKIVIPEGFKLTTESVSGGAPGIIYVLPGGEISGPGSLELSCKADNHYNSGTITTNEVTIKGGMLYNDGTIGQIENSKTCIMGETSNNGVQNTIINHGFIYLSQIGGSSLSVQNAAHIQASGNIVLNSSSKMDDGAYMECGSLTLEGNSNGSEVLYMGNQSYVNCNGNLDVNNFGVWGPSGSGYISNAIFKINRCSHCATTEGIPATYMLDHVELVLPEDYPTIFDKGILQVIVGRDEYTPEYQVDFDREKLALNGLNSTTAATYVKNRINGSVGSYYREDGEEYDIRVRYAPEFRKSIEDIENIKIYNSYGQPVRVGDLGHVVESLTPPQIQRKDRERMVSVTAVVGKGQVLSDVVKMCQEVIDDTAIPSEIFPKIAGDYETQQEMFGDLLTLLILIIILVYIVMASQFENLMKPFVIMFSVPFTFTGVLLGLWATNTALGAMAFVGVLILMGIVVKNGIVLIDYTTLLEERGVEVKEATVQAARSRLRPILMTTLTTVLGMIPLAIGRGEGAEMWNSLGITVAWGLTVSTLITLLLIPALYCSLETRAVRRKKRKAEEALTKTENIR